MISTIIKREFINYLKNPIYYIGAVLVFLCIYLNVSPYLEIGYFTEESEIKTLDYDTGLADADIMDGYITPTAEEQYDMGLDKIREIFINDFHKPESEAAAIIRELKESRRSIREIAQYLEENYAFRGADSYFYYDSSLKKATVEEANQYIRNALGRNSYSDYFSRKYVDFLSVYIIFYAILMLAFLFIRDSKKDIYELLHTKPVKAWQYVAGKVLGGMAGMVLAVTAMTAAFDVIVIFHCRAAGFPVSVWELWYAVLLYIIPNLLMITSVYTGVAILFKNPLPAIPALVLYMVYSNMGRVTEEGTVIYPRLAIVVRFQDRFFETVIPPQEVFNQIFLMVCTILILLISILIWKRRRVY